MRYFIYSYCARRTLETRCAPKDRRRNSFSWRQRRTFRRSNDDDVEVLIVATAAWRRLINGMSLDSFFFFNLLVKQFGYLSLVAPLGELITDSDTMCFENPRIYPGRFFIIKNRVRLYEFSFLLRNGATCVKHPNYLPTQNTVTTHLSTDSTTRVV